jgi:hypothetical protein
VMRSSPRVRSRPKRQDATLGLLESLVESGNWHLQRSLTLRNGEVVAASGDESPLAEDDRLLAVTTTATILQVDSVVVETHVLVFERNGR